jgi:hypothetical protein
MTNQVKMALHAFTVLCLRHTVGVLTWKLQYHNTRISDVFSVSDESLALVILENNAMIWRNKTYGFFAIDSNAQTVRKD